MQRTRKIMAMLLAVMFSFSLFAAIPMTAGASGQPSGLLSWAAGANGLYPSMGGGSFTPPESIDYSDAMFAEDTVIIKLVYNPDLQISEAAVLDIVSPDEDGGPVDVPAAPPEENDPGDDGDADTDEPGDYDNGGEDGGIPGDDGNGSEAAGNRIDGEEAAGNGDAVTDEKASAAAIDLGIKYTSAEVLNPSVDLGAIDDFGPLTMYAMTATQNNMFALTLETPGRNAVLEAVGILNANPMVEFAQPNLLYTLDKTPNDPRYGELWGMTKINAPKAWDKTTGSKRVVVGVMDTGIDGVHPDLKDNLWVNPNPGKVMPGVTGDTNGFHFMYPSRRGTPVDRHGHGTHVAGTIGAKGNNRVGVAGVNWDVSLANLGVLGDDGRGYSSFQVQALNYATNAKIDIINASLGGTGADSAVYYALRDYRGLFVASAGNDTNNNDVRRAYPACFGSANPCGPALPNVIAVAATDQNDRLAYFSNYGRNSVHVGAPGVSILSTYPGNRYTAMQGTSMAAPHVAGVAALVLSNNRNLTTAQVKMAITSTVRSVSSLRTNTITGGIVDAAAALNYNDATSVFVARLWTVILQRNIPSDQLATWTTRLRTGERTASNYAYELLGSEEFLLMRARSNRDYVEMLYQALLARKSDSSGRARYVERLAKGQRREVLAATFLRSAEFANVCKAAGVTPGSPDIPQAVNVRSFVWGFYIRALGRNRPDQSGFQRWVSRLNRGDRTGTQIAESFFFCDEMRNLRLSNEEFVKRLYMAMYGRPADSAGLRTWKGELDRGMSRSTLFNHFANAKEFSDVCASYGIKR